MNAKEPHKNLSRNTVCVSKNRVNLLYGNTPLGRPGGAVVRNGRIALKLQSVGVISCSLPFQNLSLINDIPCSIVSRNDGSL